MQMFVKTKVKNEGKQMNSSVDLNLNFVPIMVESRDRTRYLAEKILLFSYDVSHREKNWKMLSLCQLSVFLWSGTLDSDIIYH